MGDGNGLRFDGRGEGRDEREMLLFPSPPVLLPLPSPDDFDDLGVAGALFELDEGEDGGGMPDLFAFASSAAFWLLRPNGDSAAADGR